MNGWNPKKWRWMEDDFVPFHLGDGIRFHDIFSGVYPIGSMGLVYLSTFTIDFSHIGS